MKDDKYSEIEMDGLKELGNIGAGHISTTITKFLQKEVGITVPDTKFILIEDFASYLGGAENIVSCIYLKIDGELNGQAMFIFPEDCSRNLVDIILKQPVGTTTSIGENSFEESAFKEFASILTGSFLNSVSQFLKLEIVPSIPIVANDMVQSIIDSVLIKISMHADSFLSMSTKIEVLGNEINGKFIMIFEDKSLKLILSTLKNKLME